jgi:ABC-type transporter Mla maintaining outer membrane lipid asymmetry ATPase subunit MlaF
VLVTGTVDEVAAFKHPFIDEYFHGARGESAMRLFKAKQAQKAQEARENGQDMPQEQT